MAVRAMVTGAVGISAQAGATLNNGNTSSTSAIAVGKWSYILARFINSTGRYVDVFGTDGIVSGGAGLTARAPTSLDTLSIGCINSSTPTEFANGSIAELFYTATNVFPSSNTMNKDFLIQLALRGPFSMPQLRKDIIEYRSFRTHPYAGDAREIYWGRKQQIWTPANGPITGPHPPLPGNYRNHKDVAQLALV